MADARFHEVVIARGSSDVPWGFRLSENSRHPTVVRLNPRSVAAGSLQKGDLILKIGSVFTEAKPYSEILQLIKDSGNELVLSIDRGNTAKAMWTAQAEAGKAQNAPQLAPSFHSAPRAEIQQNKKPFTYTTDPRNLERELQAKHEAMKRDRQQNLARTAASRHNVPPTAALEAVMPRFSLTDEKDYTQSEVYRLLDEENAPSRPVNRAQPVRPAIRPANTQANHHQPKKPPKVLRFLSDEGSTAHEPSITITQDTISYPYVEDEEDGQGKVGDYNQKSIRYLGRNIPSKSFRMLQSLMGPGDEHDVFVDTSPQPASFKQNTGDSFTDF